MSLTRNELHDVTVDRLANSIRSVLAAENEYTVLDRLRWAPNNSFPNHEYLFDIVIVHGSPIFDVQNGISRLNHRTGVTTVVDVIDENWEAEFYDKPDLLYDSSTCEYLIYDPTAEFLRPNLNVLHKTDCGFQQVRTAKFGVFFSNTGFKLEVRGSEFSVSPCGIAFFEEDLFRCRQIYAKNPNESLAMKIHKLEEKARMPRRRHLEWE